MRPYDRPQARRAAAREARTLFEGPPRSAGDAPRPASPRPQVTFQASEPSSGPRWAVAAAAFTGRVDDPALAGLLACAAWSVRAGFACGAEERHLPGWCKSPACPRCARARASAATAHAASAWPARVLVATVRAGSGDDLPDEEAVARLGVAWDRAARAAGADRRPRLVLEPGGVTAFARSAPEPTEEVHAGAFARALAVALAGAEGPGRGWTVRVEAVERGDAAARLGLALRAEASALEAALAGASGQDEGSWRARARAAWSSRRRRRVLGGRDALAVEQEVGTTAPACTRHGRGCPPVATVLRRGATTRRLAPLPAAPGPRDLAGLSATAAPAAARAA